MLGILKLNIEKDLIKYSKFYKTDEELKLKYSGEKAIDAGIKNVINEIIEETNSLNSEINIELCDFIQHDFEVPSILSKKDEKEAIDIEFKTFCNKNNLNYKKLTYKYIITSQIFEQGKKHVVVYAIDTEYLDFVIKLFENMNLGFLGVLVDGNKKLDFSDEEISFKELMKSEITSENISKFFSIFKVKTKRSFSKELSSGEKLIIRCIACVILFIICYISISKFISHRINVKTADLTKISQNYDEEIGKINKDITKISDEMEKYKDTVYKNSENRFKITKFLENVEKKATLNVEIISIENVKDDKIKLVVQSEKYEKLGEFKKSIDENTILNDCVIKSTSKTNGIIEVCLEGKLP